MVDDRDDEAAGRRVRTRLAAVILLSVAVLVLFYAVENGATLRLDRLLLLALRQPNDPAVPVGPKLLLDIMRDTTSLGGTTVTLLLLTVAATAAALYSETVIVTFFVVAIGGGTGLVNVIKLAVARLRPDIVPHLTSEITYSFPSSHAALSVLTYGAIASIAGRLLPRLGTLALMLAALIAGAIGFSRLYLGVHYPSDVLAGWGIGLAWLLLSQIIVGPRGGPH